jgi:hypothetical protein
MPEADGVHPVRALEAVETAYSLGGGFFDKYPPLGSVLMGLAVRAIDEGLPAEIVGLSAQATDVRRERLWPLRDRIAAALQAERWVTRLAMAAAIGLLAVLCLIVSDRSGWRAGVPAVLAALGFGFSYPALYYGSTTNVDALAFAAGLLTLCLAARGRWVPAAMAAALAVAFKDPAYVLGPVVVIGALCDGPRGRGRRVLVVLLAGLASYALLAGALTGPGTWWEHIRYLLGDGIAGSDRIDHGDAEQWEELIRYSVRLVRGAIGVSGLVLGLIGLALLLAGKRSAGALLLGVIVSTILLFVAPVGFVYVRFLLLPMALLAVGVGLLLMRLFARATEGRLPIGRWVLLMPVVAGAWLQDGRVLEYQTQTLSRTDARTALPAALEQRVPDGTWVVLFTYAREHAPPIDPERWSLEVRLLDEASTSLLAWREAPGSPLPEALVFMSFENESRSGRSSGFSPTPKVGDTLRGIYEVVAVFGAPTGLVPERTLPVRPTVTLLLRLED